MDSIFNILVRCNRTFAIISGYTMLGLSLLISVEIFTRKFFNLSLQGTDEIGGYLVAVTGTYSFAYALLEKSHTRIDIVLVRLRDNTSAWFNCGAFALCTGCALFMLWGAWICLDETLLFSASSGTPLNVPLWIPQSLWLSGLLVFVITACSMTALGLAQLRHSRFTAVNRLLGVIKVSDEVQKELAEAAARSER